MKQGFSLTLAAILACIYGLVALTHLVILPPRKPDTLKKYYIFPKSTSFKHSQYQRIIQRHLTDLRCSILVLEDATDMPLGEEPFLLLYTADASIVKAFAADPDVGDIFRPFILK